MTDQPLRAPEPFAVPWPRPSLSIVLVDSGGQGGWSCVAAARLDDLAVQQGVEVILPVGKVTGGDPVSEPVIVAEGSDPGSDGDLCPRVRGMVRAAGDVVVFREVASTSGPLLGLPPLWEPCPTITSGIGDRLRAAGVVAPPAPPPTG